MWRFGRGCLLKTFDSIEFKMAAYRPLFTFTLLIFGNRTRLLDHYYKTKCEISGEDASWKISTWSNSKWPPIGHYSLSHGRYLVNRARWLDHYYRMKCEISGEDAPWKISTWSNSKWPPIGHYSLSHGRYLVNRARWLDHYYRMKCEISADDASGKILTRSNSKWPPIGHYLLSHAFNILPTVLDVSPLL